MGNPDTRLIRAVKRAFEALADAERARQQQAYMKSAMPYYGISTPDMRRALKPLFRAHPIAAREDWEATWLLLWRQARFREERYAAIELQGHRTYAAHLDPALMPLLEELIVTGAWWDFVDVLAINRVGPILASHPAELEPLLRRWSAGDDIWLRRSAILAQLKFKDRTDTGLLFELMEPSLQADEFFLRKAIGWALREHSKTDPKAVIDYVEVNKAMLSGLSKREALKVLLKQDIVKAIP